MSQSPEREDAVPLNDVESGKDRPSHQHAQMHIRRLQIFNDLLVKINQAMTLYEDEAPFLRTVCQLAVNRDEIQLAWITRWDEQKQTFRTLAAGGRVDALGELDAHSGPLASTNVGVVAETWQTGRPAFAQSYQQHPGSQPWRSWAEKYGFQAAAALPLYRKRQVWAVLVVYLDREHVFDADMKSLLQQIALDITRGLDRIDLVKRTRESANMRERLLNNALAGILMTRREIIVEANEHVARMLGYDSPKELVGQSARCLYPDEESYERICALYPNVYATSSVQASSAKLRRRDGEIIRCDISGSYANDFDNRLIVWTLIDVTVRDQLQERIQFEALHDSLTSLPNRRALDAKLQELLDRSAGAAQEIALCMIDLDDFKAVNDRHGHEAGDQVLREVSERMATRLRSTDFIARLGGDEFVIVLARLPQDKSTALIPGLLRRIHEAVETPFLLDNGESVCIGLSLGVAIYPRDASGAAELVRHADAAMYQAKERPVQSPQWWAYASPHMTRAAAAMSGAETGGCESSLEAIDQYLESVAKRFVDRWYNTVGHRSIPFKLVHHLDSEAMERLKAVMYKHFRFLMHSQTTDEQIRDRAGEIGRIHALCGVHGSWLSQAQRLYMSILVDHLTEEGIGLAHRWDILRLCGERLNKDVEAELAAGDALLAQYLDLLSSPLPSREALWSDASKNAIEQVSNLPGIRAAILMRVGPDNKFLVEVSAGARGNELASLFQTDGNEISLNADNTVTSVLAYKGGKPVATVSFHDEEVYARWRPTLHSWGIRSSMSLPICNAEGNVTLVLTLFGAYPNQFTTSVMQQFGRGLRHRWERLVSLAKNDHPMVSEQKALTYRKRVFSGGLEMFMQPTIELTGNKLHGVEALARLRMPDESIVSPGLFLPLLSTAELDRLFCLTLEQSLGALADWDQIETSPGISVNLSPTTLLDHHCARWVEQRLVQSGIDPQRLTLELLESERVQEDVQDRNLRALQDIGVRLAMDDLGSGYSSLQRLSRLPFDTIKIDQSLLLGIHKNPLPNLTLVNTILRIGQDFERTVVVEGLENEAIIEAVRILGGQYGQGYGLARPMPADKLIAWAQSNLGQAPVEQAPTIGSFMGALAFQWYCQHMHNGEHQLEPLKAFLEAKGQTDAQALHWRESLDNPRQHNARELMNWLIEKVKAVQ